jgi:predicted amidohydrolase YtcJ
MADPTTRYFTGRFVRTDLDCVGEHADPASAPEAMLVENGRITAIGSRDEVPAPAHAERVDLGEGWAVPGLIEPHGHPSESAQLLGEGVIDIRPVTVESADAVWLGIRAALAADPRPARVLANGWDPLLQRGLVPPTIDELDAIAGEIPLVIVHNSLHSAY